MVAVAEVDVLLVEVVDVSVVAHLDMSAVLAMLMVMALRGHVAGGVALVVVPVVAVVQMTVVDVVDVSDMLQGLVPAVRPVYVDVLSVDGVRGGVRCHPKILKRCSSRRSAQVYPLRPPRNRLWGELVPYALRLPAGRSGTTAAYSWTSPASV